MRRIICLGGAIAVLLCSLGTALAQKSGGILKVHHRENPPSASILEESTASTTVPFMQVFNNLVMYDQQVAQNGPQTIVPDPRQVVGLQCGEDRTRLPAAGRREVA